MGTLTVALLVSRLLNTCVITVAEPGLVNREVIALVVAVLPTKYDTFTIAVTVIVRER